MVSVVPSWPNSSCPTWFHHNIICLSDERCCSGLSDWSNIATPLRRQHTGIWLVLSISCRHVPLHSLWLCQHFRQLDAIQPTATRQRQDRVHVVYNGLSPASSAHHWSNNRLIHCDIIFNGSWPWCLHRVGSVDAESCSTDSYATLCCSTPAVYHPAADTNCSGLVAYCCTRPFSIGCCNSILFGLPVNLIMRLQSVQNAAAWLIFRIRRSEHITPALISLHWLGVPERISFKLAVLTYQSIHGTSPSYVQSCFTHVTDMTSRRRLRSSASHRLEVPPVRLSTVGKRAFPVASANMWNDLPFHITSAVTRGLQTASQDFPLLSFLPRHPDMIYWVQSPSPLV